MNSRSKIIIYLLIIVSVFSVGYFVGRITPAKSSEAPLNSEVETAETKQDLLAIVNLYGSILSLNEQKYQAGINGDSTSAENLNVQINELVFKVNQLLEKYSPAVNTESY